VFGLVEEGQGIRRLMAHVGRQGRSLARRSDGDWTRVLCGAEALAHSRQFGLGPQGCLGAGTHCSSGQGPVNSLSLNPMILQAISNASTSEIQNISFLKSKNFQTWYDGR
jgi:hypothetical protein